MQESLLREKAEAVSIQEDVPQSSKMKEIDKIYAKARAGAKKGKGAQSGGLKNKIDGRMFKAAAHERKEDAEEEFRKKGKANRRQGRRRRQGGKRRKGGWRSWG